MSSGRTGASSAPDGGAPGAASGSGAATTIGDDGDSDDGGVSDTGGGLSRGGNFGRFMVLGGLGSGGMGMVLAAYDPELDRRVAIKLLHSFRGRPDGNQARLRLQREAQAMARLSHPNVVTVFEVGAVDDQLYVAMELVDGETLRRWLTREPRSWRAIVETFSAAGRGLAAAHAAGLIHRDFKPDNVLIGKDGRVRVGDFGVASAAARPIETVGPELAAQLDAADLGHGLTAQGAAIGTPAYMAPEQQDAAAIDGRADQYAFCVALHEALYGTRPFQGASYRALREAKRQPVPDAPSGSKVPSWVRAIVLRGLGEAPGDRFPSMEALLRALGRDPAQARRRLAGFAAAAIVSGVAAWGLLRQPAALAEPCTGARDQLDGVWDGDARGRIERAFAAVAAQGAGYAPDSARRVVAGLDRYADGWATMRTEACRATRVRGEQSEQLLDLRMACLERRRDGLQQLVGVLAEADASVVERGVQTVVDLPPLSDCADTAALTATIPPPRGALMSARVAAIDAQLARAEALRSAGKYAEGIAFAEPFVRQADATGHAPLQARAHYALGELETSLARPEPAERELLAAVAFASQAHDDELLQKVLGVLSHLDVEVKRAPREGLVIAHMAEAAALRAGGDELAMAAARGRRAMALSALGSAEEALGMLEAILPITERRYGPQNPLLVSLLTRLTNVARDARRFDAARGWGERALAMGTEAYGPDHPSIAWSLIALGNVAIGQGDAVAARSYFERAVALCEKSFGPESARLATALNNAAGAAAMVGDHDAAGRMWERAIAIQEKVLGAHHPDLATSLVGLGRLRSEQHRWAEAQVLTERSLAIRIAAYGPDSHELTPSYTGLRRLFVRQQRFAEARPYAEREVALVARTRGTDHIAYGRALLDLAEIDVALGHCGVTRAGIDRGERLLETTLGPEHPELTRPLALRSQCLIRDGRPREAIPPLERIVAMLVKAKRAPLYLGDPRALLARARWATGDRAGARRDAAQAERDFLDSRPASDAALRQLRTWMRSHR